MRREHAGRDRLGSRSVTAVVLVAAALLAGCSFRGSLSSTSTTSARASGHGSGSASTSTGASTAGTTATTSAVGQPAASTSGGTGGQSSRCRTSDLGASLVPGSPGAGQRYAVVVLTDTGGRTCTIDGYGGIGLVDGSGAALPTTQVRVSSPAAQQVTLRPGQAARSQLHWAAVAGSGDAQQGACQPTPAALRVIPPDETASLSVAWTQGPVCDQGTVDQNAYAAG